MIESHAQSETTSVYTGVKVFPMLPTELSEGITSLNENEDRVAMVVEYTVDATGAVADGKAYRALVRNRAQLAYPSVGAWLEGTGPAPAKVAASADSPRSSSCRMWRRSAWWVGDSSMERLIWRRLRRGR